MQYEKDPSLYKHPYPLHFTSNVGDSRTDEGILVIIKK